MAEYKSYEEYIGHLKGAKAGFNDPKMLLRIDAAIRPDPHMAAWISAGMAAVLFIGLTAYLNFSAFRTNGADAFKAYIFQPYEKGGQSVFNYVYGD